jgi:hypothetical protein
MTDRSETAWGRLSDEAQNILEWLENVHSEVLHLAEIRVGCIPRFDGKIRSRDHQPVEQAHFDEMLAYVSADPGCVVVSSDDTSFTAHLVGYKPVQAPTLRP